ALHVVEEPGYGICNVKVGVLRGVQGEEARSKRVAFSGENRQHDGEDGEAKEVRDHRLRRRGVRRVLEGRLLPILRAGCVPP
ncbi:MAG TPA: hypothetical protein VNL92_01000, partial [Dehalococcoidia bacterium]|nr:hypothetical protein [Dehalococcoidia bacterium]